MEDIERSSIIWSDYIKYRAELRGFELKKIESILRHSGERYVDVVTRRMIVVGRHDERLVMVPYEKTTNSIIPSTVHTITRQQIKFRLKSGRLVNE